MSSPLDLNNVQGDIPEGLPKKGETFFFFRIERTKVEDFCTRLMELIPLITTAAQVEDDRARIAAEKKRAAENDTNPMILDMTGINIAFSHKGLKALSINDDIEPTPLAFSTGMFADAKSLGDAAGADNLPTQWESQFKEDIHGVILITGSKHTKIDEALSKVKAIFGSSIHQVHQVVGHTRPGDISGHEHFGFADGISQPFIDGFSSAPRNPGQDKIPQGIILASRDSDDVNDSTTFKRPKWALDGSFLCFRKLKQLVPEFNKFLEHNPLPVPTPIGPGDPTGAELLGARLVGRWTSGAPIDNPSTSIRDDPDLGADPFRNNDFRYDPLSQERCPFAAHTRKTNPRSDFDGPAFGLSPQVLNKHRILRRGIQYGPEVTDEEKASGVSNPALERGLLFVSYQSNIDAGFRFIQKSWANNPGFIFTKGSLNPPIPRPGFDALIGSNTDPDVQPATQVRDLVGMQRAPGNPAQSLVLTNIWVVPKGGEYFFSPSISALQNTFAQAA